MWNAQISKALGEAKHGLEGADTAKIEDYLGPGAVIEIVAKGVHVALSDGRAKSATMALAVPYRPAVGDVLLVIGKGDSFYVIGVIDGKGSTELCLQGDVHVHATGGALRLGADKGVQISGQEVDIETRRLNVVAGKVVEHLQSVVRRVTGLLSVQAGDAHTIADGTVLQQSKTATILTEETVTVNGKQVHLG